MCLFVPVVSAVVQSPTVVIDLLRQVRADEIIDDTMNNRVVACGNLAFPGVCEDPGKRNRVRPIQPDADH
jgi:hypothetical protein